MVMLGYTFILTTLLLALMLPATRTPALMNLVAKLRWRSATSAMAFLAAGLIVLWLFCFIVMLVEYARLNRTSWLGQELATGMSQPYSFGIILLVGVLLYVARYRFLILYGFVETVGAAAVLWFSLPPQSQDLMTNATTLGACLYFLFRGLDNIRYAIDRRP